MIHTPKNNEEARNRIYQCLRNLTEPVETIEEELRIHSVVLTEILQLLTGLAR